MRKAILPVAIVMLLVALAPVGNASHSVSHHYDLAATWPVGLVGTAGGLYFGGYTFPASDVGGHVPVRVTVADASGGDVKVKACQDVDGDNQCAVGDDPASPDNFVNGCTTSMDLIGNHGAFSPNLAVLVGIRIWAPDCPSAVATTGTITLVTG